MTVKDNHYKLRQEVPQKRKKNNNKKQKKQNNF